MKKILVALVALAAALSVHALDVGLVLDNSTVYEYESEGALFQKDRATLWLSTPISADFDLFASVRADYRYPDAPAPWGMSPFSADVGWLELKGTFKTASGAPVDLSLGRFVLADEGGKIMYGRYDGARVALLLPTMTFGGFLGYTGLLPKQEARVLVSVDDIADYENPDRYFAPNRAVFNAKVAFTELFARHDLSLTLAGQFDLRKLADKTPDELAHSQYLSAVLRGPIGNLLFHEAYVDVGGGERTSGFALMVAAGYSIKLFLPEAANFKVSGSVDFASGTMGALAPFVPINQRPVGFAFDAPLGNNLNAVLDVSVKPVSVVTCGLKGAAFLRPSAQKLEDPYFDDASTDLYLGSEADLYVTLDLASDVSISLAGGAFLPNSGGAFVSDAPPRYIVSGTATVSF